ncbi:MAG: FAD-dependent oxidoreductase [Bacillota bacterium]
MRDRVNRTTAFCCSCAETMDTGQMAEYLGRQPDVDEVGEHPCLCASEGLRFMAEKIRAGDADRVLVASCLSGSREEAWRRLLEDEGLDPQLMRIAPVREWEAPAARLDAVAMALRHLRRLESIPPCEVPVVQRALVIGAGIGGMQAALDLDRLGVDVVLVDEGELGGRTRAHLEWDAHRSDLASQMISRVRRADRVEIVAPARVRKVEGQVGDFTAALEDDSGVRTVRAGAIVLATGYETAFPRDSLGLHPGGAVIGLSGLWDFLDGVEGVTVPGTSRAFDIAFLLREEDERGRLPFAAALQGAVAAKRELKCEVCMFFENAKVAGEGLEELYREARRLGVVMIRYDEFPRISETDVPVTYQADEGERRPLQVTFTGEHLDSGPADGAGDGERVLGVDVLISGEDILPSAETRRVAEILDLERTAGGFVGVDNVFMTGALTNRRGVFAVGGCRGPRTIDEILGEAGEAALAAWSVLSRGVLKIRESVAVVDQEKCALCLTCIRSCPAGAISVDREHNAARVSPEACEGCGICASECPAEAIQLQRLTDGDVLSVLEALREVAQ